MRNRLKRRWKERFRLPQTPETNSDHDGGKYIPEAFGVKVFVSFHFAVLISNSYQTDKNI